MLTPKYIAERWNRTLALVKPPIPEASPRLLSGIVRSYSGRGRFYHNLDHLRMCFSELDEVMAKLAGTGVIELALWYHDFIHDTRATNNEEQSADVAEKATFDLGFSKPYAKQVKDLVLATKHLNPPGTREAKVLLDLDLTILGTDTATFDKYERSIRQEYRRVPEEVYRRERSKILQGFLDRTWIYHTPEFRFGPHEGRARTNLERSVKNLTCDPP